MNVRFSTEPANQVSCDVLAVPIGSDDLQGDLAALDGWFGGNLSAEVDARCFKGSTGTILVVSSLGRIAARVLVLVGAGDKSPAALRSAAGRAGREARTLRANSFALWVDGDQASAVGLLEGAIAGNYAYQPYKPEDERSSALSEAIAVGVAGPDLGAAAGVRGRWQGWTRDLVNAPPADLYPESLAAKARELAALDNVTVEVWDFDRCRAEGCVGIVAVGQGSDQPGCLIHVRYTPPNARDHIALVGKGVTFDAGGLSLKPSSGMQTMRCDMGGAATMLGAAGAIAELGLPITVDCFVGAVENMVSGNSYKLGDILRYRNGVTVEIHNTDAEGRLVLADCLIEASKLSGVTAIIDSATLTGACVVAVGNDFTALFTDSDALAGELHAAATVDAEGLWRLPLHAPYKELLKGEWGQIKNVGGRAAGATTAALFLSYFVDSDADWAHLDIAGSAFIDKANNRYVAGATGEMVRTLTSWAAARVA